MHSGHRAAQRGRTVDVVIESIRLGAYMYCSNMILVPRLILTVVFPLPFGLSISPI